MFSLVLNTRWYFVIIYCTILQWEALYFALVIKTRLFYKKLSNYVGAIWYLIHLYNTPLRLKVFSIFPGYAEKPKNLSLVTELSLASSANLLLTNVEVSTVASRSRSRKQQPRQFYVW